jgi:hypothetical protein
MPTHRKERGAEPRHRAPPALRRPARSALTGVRRLRPRPARALRILVVTPQFAAGAGIVIAAMLAVDMPHAALSYGPNPEVRTCAPGSCATTKPSPGGLATSDPSVKLRPARPKAAALHAVQAVRKPEQAGPEVDIRYQTIRTSPSGFVGMIVISSRQKLGSWNLAFTFSAARVEHVWGGQWQPDGTGGGGVVTGQPWPWPGQTAGSPRVVVFATGAPSKPVSCTFDGATCTFS